uniref:Uncharacterized protein n=1 Tax=Chromera velia CCMP2878 TaxID=1169474 RepID=A0A0G4HIF5_9ALVE|eukprot:Cvel_6999.t1-p1 / transcript=Cvel_6999.t1 / gene=Cvel_6999 / organism=Chromera_velia_CCMP2878 / gene_product=hypothetical protein / transcript_product=hypothetical protein / location=Cvel_scaffold356:51021-51709(-) / protein_length=181 / sequence_SO=supercontig / SO=protein_coding / is_pseudo=false
MMKHSYVYSVHAMKSHELPVDVVESKCEAFRTHAHQCDGRCNLEVTAVFMSKGQAKHGSHFFASCAHNAEQYIRSGGGKAKCAGPGHGWFTVALAKAYRLGDQKVKMTTNGNVDTPQRIMEWVRSVFRSSASSSSASASSSSPTGDAAATSSTADVPDLGSAATAGAKKVRKGAGVRKAKK